MTARRALAALEQQGLIRIEQGNGTFVSDGIVRYSLGARVRFNRNLQASNAQPRRQLLASSEVGATQKVASWLDIPTGHPVLKFDIVGYADDRPISVVSRYAPADRFFGLDEAFKRTGSFSEALRSFGVEDFHRKTTEAIARLPTRLEARLLEQPKTQAVLAYESVDVDQEGIPISYQVGCFAGERVALVIDEEERGLPTRKPDTER